MGGGYLTRFWVRKVTIANIFFSPCYIYQVFYVLCLISTGRLQVITILIPIIDEVSSY